MNQIPYFDAHCDTISYLANTPGSSLDTNTRHWNIDEMCRFGKKSQFFAVFHDSAIPGKEFAVQRQISKFEEMCECFSGKIKHCRNAEEADLAFQQGSVAAFLSVEGGELLGCSVEKLEWAYQKGVRAINLTWNHANCLSGSHIEESNRGLSKRGQLFVRRMNELGMIVDVSHLSDAGFFDLADLTDIPFIASHSNSRFVHFNSRNLTDEQITVIIAKCGVIGLNCYTAFLGNGTVDFESIRRHLDHILDLGGEKTVALGGDWDGCDSLPEGFSGSWNWYDFYQYLLRYNYPKDFLQDLFFNNLMRVVRQVCII